jgi:NAD(P)-dependent dehydrogenase (short-subunit alcohol dehydrogenase family)
VNPTYDFSDRVALVTGAGAGAATDKLTGAGHQALGVACDVADEDQVAALVDRTVAEFGRLDMAFNNAGIMLPLADGGRRAGRADAPTSPSWTGAAQCATSSYSDSKLFVTTLAVALARLWPDVHSNAVDPGWVPTRMGGPGAPDDLRLGHLTQGWLATSDEPEARTSGGYWFHQRLGTPHPAVRDTHFQDSLLAALARFTAVPLT